MIVSLDYLPVLVRQDPSVLAAVTALCTAAEAHTAARVQAGYVPGQGSLSSGDAVLGAAHAYQKAVDAALDREHAREQAEDAEDAHLYMAHVQDGFLVPTHDLVPTDNQGYSGECVRPGCGALWSLHQGWDKEECTATRP